jgi:hypothetical protein
MQNSYWFFYILGNIKKQEAFCKELKPIRRFQDDEDIRGDENDIIIEDNFEEIWNKLPPIMRDNLLKLCYIQCF